MADDPKTDSTPPTPSTREGQWQPPEWRRGKPAEWKSTTWEEWVARDSPFAPKEPVAAPEPTPEPERSAEPPLAASVPTFRARAWESLGLELYDWLTDDQVARLVTQDRTGRVVDGPTFRQLARELLGDPDSDEQPFAVLRRTRSEGVNWVARGLLVFFAMILLSPLGIWAVLVALLLLVSLFGSRRATNDPRRGILDAYRKALKREHRQDPERGTGLEPHERSTSRGDPTHGG